MPDLCNVLVTIWYNEKYVEGSDRK